MRKILFISLLCLVLMTLVFGQTSTLQQKPMHGLQINKLNQFGDPTAFWLFNEDTGNIVNDLSGNGHIGTLAGTAHFVPGKFGPAIEFDGDSDYISISTTPPINNFTFIAAVNIDSFHATNNRYIIEKIDNDFLLGVDGDDNANKVKVYAEDTTAGWVEGSSLLVNTEYILAATYDGVSMKIYINGVLDVSTPCTGNIVDDNAGYIMGVDDGFTSGIFFDGIIHYIMAYNRALNDSEIAQLYREPFCVIERIPIWTYRPAVVTPSGQVIIITMD